MAVAQGDNAVIITGTVLGIGLVLIIINIGMQCYRSEGRIPRIIF